MLISSCLDLGMPRSPSGTYINVTLRSHYKPRFRNITGQICTNTLAVCDHNLRFVYLLPGWEGSDADGRVLRDSVNRINELKIPRDKTHGCFIKSRLY